MTRHETTLAPPESGAKLPPPGLAKRDRRAVTGFVERLLAVEGQSTPFFALLHQTDAQLAALLASEAVSGSSDAQATRIRMSMSEAGWSSHRP